eukprot:CCRYP_007653-RA/>CCRYP_007653-RA protein AED:0.10 eAED:-0.09 QI:0/-1/0/1/-1/0/1/0/74
MVEHVLQTLVYSSCPHNMTQAQDIVDQALDTSMHAMRTRVTTTLGITSGAIAFSMDVVLKIHVIANWKAISCSC